MKEMDALKEQILAEADRLGPEDTFSFRCHPGLDCFNKCCADVNIVLTPYDLLRLKRRLGVSSGELLERYTLRPFSKELQLPVVVLRMEDRQEGKPCPFVTPQGCSVYADRPWPCRMYPVGTASARTEEDPHAPEFYFLIQEEPCDGFQEGRTISIREWLTEQGIDDYAAAGEGFKELTLHPHFKGGGSLNPQQMEMFFTACYDLDRFRGFVFESSFLEKYEVAPELVERMRADDEELLRFAYRWLRTCLFSEGLVPLRSEVKDAYQEKMAAQGRLPRSQG